MDSAQLTRGSRMRVRADSRTMQFEVAVGRVLLEQRRPNA